MTPQHLRQIADRTGLDGIAEALREAADEIDALQARAQVQGEPVWCVATGERVNGEETYTHHDAYVPPADCFPLYTHPAPSVPATGEPVVVQHRKPVIGWKGQTIGYTGWRDGKGLDGWPHRDLYDHPAPGVPDALKDHQIAALVNKVRDIARMFHDHQSLRERIAIELVPALKASQEVKSNAERWRTFLATRPSSTHEGIIAAIDAAMLAAK